MREEDEVMAIDVFVAAFRCAQKWMAESRRRYLFWWLCGDEIRVQERERVCDVRAKNEQSAADAPIADGQEGKAARGASKRWETGMFVSCGRLGKHLSRFFSRDCHCYCMLCSNCCQSSIWSSCHRFLKQCARKILATVMWKVCPCARWNESNHRGLYRHKDGTLMERTLVFLQGVRVPNPRSVSLNMSSIMIKGVTCCSGDLLWWTLGLLSPLGKNLEINLPS